MKSLFLFAIGISLRKSLRPRH